MPKKIQYKRKMKAKSKSKSKSDSDSDSDEEGHIGGLSNLINPTSWLFGPKDDLIIKDNHIWFNTSVNKKTTNSLVTAIHDLNMKYNEKTANLSNLATCKPNPINLHINSYGGDLLATMAVIDAIKDSKIPVHTIVEGCAASAATLMSVFGSKRLITEHSYMLIHQLSSSLHGKMNEIEDDFENNKVFMEKIKDIYVSKTKMSRSEVTNALKHDLWWDAYTCLEKGLVDEIVNVTDDMIRRKKRKTH